MCQATICGWGAMLKSYGYTFDGGACVFFTTTAYGEQDRGILDTLHIDATHIDLTTIWQTKCLQAPQQKPGCLQLASDNSMWMNGNLHRHSLPPLTLSLQSVRASQTVMNNLIRRGEEMSFWVLWHLRYVQMRHNLQWSLLSSLHEISVVFIKPWSTHLSGSLTTLHCSRGERNGQLCGWKVKSCPK